MAYLWICLVVLTLLQLSRAEISDTLHEPWYSANVINEGFHPKPISEIFSTEATFSQTDPIIILSKSSIVPNDVTFWPTYTPPIRPFSTTGPNISETVQLSTSSPIVPYSKETDKTSSTTSSTFRPPNTTLAVSIQTQPEQTTVEQPIEPVIAENLPSAQPTSVESNIQTPTSSSSPQTAPIVRQHNFVVIYQQIPHSIRSVLDLPQTYSVEPSQSQAPAQTFPETTILPQSTSSTAIPSIDTPTTSLSTNVHESYMTTPFSSPTLSTLYPSYKARAISDILPSTLKPFFPLRIRVLAPSGSITNVKINPATTTKKPTTIRTRKPKPKNNLYKICLDTCERSKIPICAAPLTKGLIDPSTLKGFPSICHMACYNAFKEERYEKLVDGRCGKLRTRIRPVDSNKKLKRTELTKSEYTIENTGPKTIVEFSGLV